MLYLVCQNCCFDTEEEYRKVNKLLLLANKCITMYKYGTHSNLIALFEAEKSYRKKVQFVIMYIDVLHFM